MRCGICGSEEGTAGCTTTWKHPPTFIPIQPVKSGPCSSCAALKAEVERLTRERDEAVASMKALNQLLAERERDEPHKGYSGANFVAELWEKSRRMEVATTAAEARVAGLRSQIAMTVHRLGGEVEGAPTHSGNFLQRIDALTAAEKQRDEARGRVAVLEGALGGMLSQFATGFDGHRGVVFDRIIARARAALSRKGEPPDWPKCPGCGEDVAPDCGCVRKGSP